MLVKPKEYVDHYRLTKGRKYQQYKEFELAAILNENTRGDASSRITSRRGSVLYGGINLDVKQFDNLKALQEMHNR